MKSQPSLKAQLKSQKHRSGRGASPSLSFPCPPTAPFYLNARTTHLFLFALLSPGYLPDPPTHNMPLNTDQLCLFALSSCAVPGKLTSPGLGCFFCVTERAPTLQVCCEDKIMLTGLVPACFYKREQLSSAPTSIGLGTRCVRNRSRFGHLPGATRPLGGAGG